MSNATKGFADFGLPVIEDDKPELLCPAAGLMTGLKWLRTLREVDWSVFAPVDAPFVPRDFVVRLVKEESNANAVAACAVARSQLHPTVSGWSVDFGERLWSLIHDSGALALHKLLPEVNALSVSLDANSDMNLAFLSLSNIRELESAAMQAR